MRRQDENTNTPKYAGTKSEGVVGGLSQALLQRKTRDAMRYGQRLCKHEYGACG